MRRTPLFLSGLLLLAVGCTDDPATPSGTGADATSDGVADTAPTPDVTVTDGVAELLADASQGGADAAVADATEDSSTPDAAVADATVDSAPDLSAPDGGPGFAVTGVSLINADSDQPISGFDPIAAGATLDLENLPTTNLNLRANVTGTVGSVTFDLNGQTVTESVAPYAFAGDNAGDYAAWTPAAGTFTLVTTPYGDGGGAGTAGSAHTLTFTVEDGGGTGNPGNGTTCTLAATGAANGTDGDLFILEAEDLLADGPVGSWELGTGGGHTYIWWTGSQSTGSPGPGQLQFQIDVATPGRYVLDAHVQVGMGTNSTEHNDTWFKFPDAADSYGMKLANSLETRRYPKPECEDSAFIDSILALPQVSQAQCAAGGTAQGFFKVYCSGALNWKWSAFTNDNDAFPVHVEFPTAGVYTVQLAPRSSHHRIDRIVLRHEDVPAADARDLGLAASPCAN